MKWILDASVAVRWFLQDEMHSHADSVLERVVHVPGVFAVPELFAFETFSVLQRLHPEPLGAFVDGIIPILQGGLLRYPMTFSLAERANRFVEIGLTGYDACYVGLAEELEGMWLTFDERAVQTLDRPQLACCIAEGLPKEWAG
jgi:predicted nucleic acid-binding protein